MHKPIWRQWLEKQIKSDKQWNKLFEVTDDDETQDSDEEVGGTVQEG